MSAPENGELATSPAGSGHPESYSESFVTVENGICEALSDSLCSITDEEM